MNVKCRFQHTTSHTLYQLFGLCLTLLTQDVCRPSIAPTNRHALHQSTDPDSPLRRLAMVGINSRPASIKHALKETLDKLLMYNTGPMLC
jgi:hypothetical protein